MSQEYQTRPGVRVQANFSCQQGFVYFVVPSGHSYTFYRHVFEQLFEPVPPSPADTIAQQAARIAELEAGLAKAVEALESLRKAGQP